MLQVSEETEVEGPYAKSMGLQGMSQCPKTHRHCISPVLVKAQLPNAKLEAAEGGLALHKLEQLIWIWRSEESFLYAFRDLMGQQEVIPAGEFTL